MNNNIKIIKNKAVCFIHFIMNRTLLILMASSFMSSSHATVEEYAEFVIPYQRLQSEYTCLDTQLMNASFGIPLFSLLVGVFHPTMTLNSAIPPGFEDINILTKNGTISHNYIHDATTPTGVVDYKLSIDMANVDSINGNTLVGRQTTIDKAKLAVISIVKTAEVLHGSGNFRVWVKVDNLPNQVGLSGTNLVTMLSTTATSGPMWPYTSSSPLLQSYIGDVINAGC